MNLRRLGLAALVVALLVIITPNSAQAQAAGGGAGAGGAGGGAAGGRQGGNRQRGANADPAQARQRQLDRIKQQLGSSDDEWKVLEPKVDKLLTAQQDARGGRGGAAGGGRRNRGQQGAQAATPAPTTVEPSAVAKATTELRAAVDDKSSTPEVLAEKLKALRDAKEKAKTDRATAQKELRELLTARQEAVLVNMGMLD